MATTIPESTPEYPKIVICSTHGLACRVVVNSPAGLEALKQTCQAEGIKVFENGRVDS